jgi:hypothetical protein
MKVGFSETVKKFAQTAPKAFEFVWRASMKDLVEEMQTPRESGGNMPVWTQFLRASLMASTSHMPAMIKGHRPASMDMHFPYNPAPLLAVIESAKLGQTVYFGYAADYAAYQEYGTRYFTGRRFRTRAAQKWPSIVAKNAAVARQMFGL